jgi:hypothetical protein
MPLLERLDATRWRIPRDGGMRVDIVDRAGIARKVAQLRPLAVVKG